MIKSKEANFNEKTWTFEIDESQKVSAWEYIIIKNEKLERFMIAMIVLYFIFCISCLFKIFFSNENIFVNIFFTSLYLYSSSAFLFIILLFRKTIKK